MLFCILKTKKKWPCVLKGTSDACMKADARTKDDARMAYMMMWHEFKIIVAL